jgi:TPR repeat protein
MLRMSRTPAAPWAAVTVLVAALTSSGSVTAAEKPWIEVRTPHFLVVANTGEGDARDIGWQFEQVRVAFQLIWPWARRESGRPFVVFAVRDKRDLRELAPKFWENGGDGTSAVSVSGRDKDYFALLAGLSPADDVGTNPYYYAYWGYATQMLEANYPGRLPPWFKRGMADFFANTLVQKKQVHVGRIIRHHARELGERSRMSLAEILEPDWKSEWLTDDKRRSAFDAHAWMLVHYLTLGEERAWLVRFNRFAELLRQGVSSAAAFPQAMGDVPAVERGFRDYVGRTLYAYVALQTDVNVKPGGFAVRTLPGAESLALRAGFHVAMSRPVEARALLAEARKAEPPSIVTDEVGAQLLDSEDKDKEALELYSRAASGGSTNFYVFYRRGSLLWQPNAQKEVVAEAAAAYAQAVSLNPDHAWAQTSLARALAEVDPGERAIAAARKSTTLEPGVVAHRLALTKALSAAGKSDEARSEAERSLALSSTVEDRADAQRWIDYLARGSRSAQAESSMARPNAGPDATSTDWVATATTDCDGGQVGACTSLASAMLSGQGAPKDVPKALGFLEKACELSDFRACAYAAYARFDGMGGVPRDTAGATRLAARACDGGALQGCTTLALVLAGRGTRGDLDQARGLLKKACDAGESQACTLLPSLPK